MKHFLAILGLLALTSCAAMQQQYIDQMCNTEGAYQQGYNDGHGTGQMNGSFANMCPADQDAIRRAYRDGFENGSAQRAQEPQPVEVHIVHDHQNNQPLPGWQCHDNFGQRVCGYDCRDAYGTVKCARQSDHNCVAAFGVIKCGYRCREEFGEIQCDRYE
jgi:hypothetical protein